MLARKADYLKALAREIRQGGATVLDLSLRCQRSHANNRSVSRHPQGSRRAGRAPLHAGSGTFGAISEITPDQYEADWR